MNDNCYFAASVGGDGFSGDFDEIFAPEKFDTVYIIKGGPGTGKSTFMKKLGEVAERRGFIPEYYFCSSDISSLDGVVIPEKRVAVLDGTAPHVTEAKYPGACEMILNFCDALDSRALKAERGEIVRLCKEKSEAYARAYADLRASREFLSENIRVCHAAYLQDKARDFIRRAFSGMAKGDVRRADICTVCSRGRVRLPVYEKRARRVMTVKNAGGAGYLFMSDVEAFAREAGLSAVVSRDPVCRGYAESVYFDGDGVYVALWDGDAPEGKEVKNINVARFVDKGAERAARPYLRLTKKLFSDALAAAVDSLSSASAAHGEIEKIYVKSTDFHAIDAMLERVKREIFENPA